MGGGVSPAPCSTHVHGWVVQGVSDLGQGSVQFSPANASAHAPMKCDVVGGSIVVGVGWEEVAAAVSALSHMPCGLFVSVASTGT